MFKTGKQLYYANFINNDVVFTTYKIIKLSEASVTLHNISNNKFTTPHYITVIKDFGVSRANAITKLISRLENERKILNEQNTILKKKIDRIKFIKRAV